MKNYDRVDAINDASTEIQNTNEMPSAASATVGITSEKSEAKEIVKKLLMLYNDGKLFRKPEEYIKSKDFILLLKEYGLEAAISMFDADAREESAYARGKEDGLNNAMKEIRGRGNMPKPIRPGIASLAETDFFNMNGKEFENYKKRLINA
ncbi:MAG: hypothetical protein RRY79_00230 [Clostridia bacterium]